MSVKSTLGIFVSGFIVYGTVAALVGGGSPHPRVGTARSALSVWIDPVAAARADSGSRLKAEFLLGDDGSKDYQLTFEPWIFNPPLNSSLYDHPVSLYWDSMRNEECSFQPAADAVMRCMPTSTANVGGPWAAYVDAACTQLGVGFPPAPPGCTLTVPQYVMYYDQQNQTCSMPSGMQPMHIYPVGSFIGPNAPCYYLNQGVCTAGGGCPIIGGNGQGGVAIYSVGAEVPAASFVGSMPSHDP